MNDCTPDGPQSEPEHASDTSQAHHRLTARRRHAGDTDAETAEVAARFDFSLADELYFLDPDGSPCQLAMRLTHKRTGQEQCVVLCRRTPRGEEWEVLCSPWFDDEAALYLRAVQERVARNRARRLGEPVPGGGRAATPRSE